MRRGGANPRKRAAAAFASWLSAACQVPLWVRLLLAFVGTSIAVLLRWALGEWVGQPMPPFITFYPFILAVALIGGAVPGILATLLSALAVAFFGLPPTGSLRIDNPAEQLSLVLFCGINAVVSMLCGALRSVRCQDVSEAQRSEASERRLRATFDQAAMGIVEVGKDGRFLAVNQRLSQMLGYRQEELVGMTAEQLTHPEDRASSTRLNTDLQEGRRSMVDFEKRYLKRDGMPLWVHVTISAVVDRDGQWSRSIATVEDISERKKIEQSLKESELRERQRANDLASAVRQRDEALAQLNALLANAPVGFAFFDRDHRYTRINEFLAREITGLPVEAHLGRHVSEMLAANTTAVEPLLDRVFGSGDALVNIELTGRTPAAPGQRRHWLTGWFPVRTPNGEIPWVGAVVIEITRQKRIEADLQRRNLHLDILHQAAADLLLGDDPVRLLRALHERIVSTFGTEVFMFYQANGDNRLRLEACAGLTDEERLKLSSLRFGRLICTGRSEALQPLVATQIQSNSESDRRFLRKQGFRSYLYYPLTLNGRIEGTLSFASRKREAFEPSEIEFFHTIARTVGEALQRQRLERELHRHVTQLGQLVEDRTVKLSETVRELEAFSYSLVHDMRAPLRAMEAYATVLEEHAANTLDSEGLEYLHRIRSAALRMDQLITDSLNYSKIVRDELPLGPVDVGELLRGLVHTYPNLQPPGADVRVEIDHLVVQANEAALTQVFSNLMGNAVKFVSPGITPRVRVWEQALPAAPGAVLVWIEDNGIGIPTEAQGKIFGMFQRLHRGEDYPGTGIGLAIVKKSLERIGGQICLESEPGKGTRFCVELPRSPVERAAEQAA